MSDGDQAFLGGPDWFSYGPGCEISKMDRGPLGKTNINTFSIVDYNNNKLCFTYIFHLASLWPSECKRVPHQLRLKNLCENPKMKNVTNKT